MQVGFARSLAVWGGSHGRVGRQGTALLGSKACLQRPDNTLLPCIALITDPAIATSRHCMCSAVTEARCVAVVGASGIVFGAGAVVVADTIHNFETLSRPVLRTTVMLSFLIYFGASVGTTPTGTSHMSHVGGFMCGLLAALVILRNPHRGRAELACTAVGAAGCLAIFIALPCIFYLHQLPRVQC